MSSVNITGHVKNEKMFISKGIDSGVYFPWYGGGLGGGGGLPYSSHSKISLF